MNDVLLGCRCAIALVFVASILGKVRGQESYAGFVRAAGRLASGRVTARVPAGALAGGVIAAEAAVVVLTVLPATARVGLGLAGLLATAFAVAILAAVRRGDRAPCNCFGSSARPVGRVHLVRNAVLIVVAGLGLAAGAVDAGPVGPAGGAAAVIVGAVLAALVVRADDLAELFGPVAPATGHRTRKGSSR
jgi:hypothetical protein